MTTLLGPDAARALVEAHLEWAKSGAIKFARRSGGRYTVEEFHSAAVIGLIAAARRFDPSRGFVFKTCAMPWVEQHMRRVFQEDRRQTGWRWDKNRGLPGGQSRVRVRVPWPESAWGEPYQLLAPVTSPDAEIEREQLRRLLLRCARDARQRRIVALQLAGLTQRQIAARLGCGAMTVYAQQKDFLARARANATLREPVAA